MVSLVVCSVTVLISGVRWRVVIIAGIACVTRWVSVAFLLSVGWRRAWTIAAIACVIFHVRQLLLPISRFLRVVCKIKDFW